MGTMLARATALLALGACGRLGFGDLGRDAAQPIDATVIDAPELDAFARRTAPPPGSILVLDGTGYVSIDSLTASLGGAFTISLWVNADLTQGGATYTEIVALNNATGSSNLSLLQWVTAPPSVNYYDDTYTNGPYTDVATNAGTWHYVSLVVDAAKAGTIYVDAQVRQTFTTTRSVGPNARFSLGQEWDGTTPGEFFVGALDELAVWSGTRTSQQLVVDMTFVPDFANPTLVGYFDFEGGGVVDRSGNGHIGTVSGGVTFPVQ